MTSKWVANEVAIILICSVFTTRLTTSINDGQIRCQADPSVHKTAYGKLYRNDSVRDNDTSVQSQPPPEWGSSKEGGRERSSRG